MYTHSYLSLKQTLTDVLKLACKQAAAVRQVFSVRKPFFIKSATASYKEQKAGSVAFSPGK